MCEEAGFDVFFGSQWVSADGGPMWLVKGSWSE